VLKNYYSGFQNQANRVEAITKSTREALEEWAKAHYPGFSDWDELWRQHQRHVKVLGNLSKMEPEQKDDQEPSLPGQMDDEKNDSNALGTDPLANANGVYTKETAGDHYEQIEISIPDIAQYKARIEIVKTSQGDCRKGIHAAKTFGDFAGMGYAPSIQGDIYNDRKSALKAGLLEILKMLRIQMLTPDAIMNNEGQKERRIQVAINSLKDFASIRGIVLEPVEPKEKIGLHLVYLTTKSESRKPDFSQAFTAHSWKEADDYALSQVGKHSDVYYWVIWEDAESVKGYIDIEPSDEFKNKPYILSGYLQVYFENVSKEETPNAIVSQEDIDHAGEILRTHFFTDDTTDQPESAKQDQDSSQPLAPTHTIIMGLEDAYWREEDNKYPVNRAEIRGMAFDQARLRSSFEILFKKRPIQDQEIIASEVASNFKERNPIEVYEKSLVTIGKKGDKRRSKILWAYIDDIIIDRDIWVKSGWKVCTFLIDLLTKDQTQYVDMPADVEKTKPATKKQTAFQLNQAIEAFIDKKDNDGDGFSEQDRTYIREYTGGGGLLKEGAQGRGTLYEYYTPDEIVQKMWGLAFKYGYTNGRVLEPACGTGNFLKYVPVDAMVDAYETNHYSKRIAEILYPYATVIEKPFESLFFAGNIHLKNDFEKDRYGLVIGNPPYGEFNGKYAGMGEKKWTGVTEYEHYFILRGLDLLISGGLLVLLVPSAFLSNPLKFNGTKEKIAARAELLDAYRLPGRLFDTTDIGTDIIVMQKH
jgi:hypothetical protein